MENTLIDSEHIVAALAAAGVKARSEMTGGHVYVTYVNVGDSEVIGITNESAGDDGWLVCRYDPRDEEDEGVALDSDIPSTEAVVELVRRYVYTYLSDELERRKQA